MKRIGFKSKKIAWFGIAVSFFLFWGIVGNASAQQKPIVIKFAWHLPMTNYASVGSQNLAKSIEEASKGKVKVETYPAGQLYKGNELFTAVRSGAVEMSMFALGTFAMIDPMADIVYLPFVARDKEHMFKVLHGRVGKRLESGAEKSGTKILGYFAGSGGQYGTRAKAIRKPEDFKGLKIRVPGALAAETVQALGAAPTTLAATEVYLALQRGTVDGSNFPLSSFYDRKLFEVLKYLTVANVSFDPDAVLVNLKFWENLPADIQESIQKCTAQAEKWVYDEETKVSANYKKMLGEKGMEVIEIPKGEMANWGNAVKPVLDKFVSRVGSEGKDLTDYISKEAQ
jgi:tripartite ATP-independent transporter DctP family solute receptor